MADKENTEITYKVLLLGDSSVGKTCFLKRYIDNTFQDAYLSTIGFDFKFKNVTLKDGKKVKVQLWDTAGQERFRTIAKSYYKGAHGIVLIYDVTSKRTYENIRKWLNQIKEEASNRISIILVANKIDCEGEREVSKDEGESLAKTSGLTLFEASAKDSINVNESFQYLIERISEKYANINSNTTKLNNSKNENKDVVKYSFLYFLKYNNCF
jgi:small GTP-binding protein